MTRDPKNPLAKFGLNEDGTPIPSPYDVIDDGITDDPFADRPRRGPKRSRRDGEDAPADAPADESDVNADEKPAERADDSEGKDDSERREESE